MTEFLGNLKTGDMNLLRPLSSDFRTLNPNLNSIIGYFQNFNHFQPFLAKMAEILGMLKMMI